MEHLLNPRVKNIEISGIRQFNLLAQQVPDVLALTIGEPDVPTPEHVRTAGISAIAEGRTRYTHNAGLLELRRAASAYVQQRLGVSYDPASEVIATIGATQALDIAFRTLLTEGSEVVIPAPVYPGYEPVARLCGAKVLLVDTSRHRFRLSAAWLEPYLTPRTRLVVLPYPANPTGTVLNRAELSELAALLSQREVFVVSDEIYSELVFSESYTSIVQFPGMRERTVLVQGLSKSHAMTGWRIGFVLAPRALAQHMLKVHQYSALCAPVATQYAALEALTHGLDDPAPMRETYRRRRDLACARLQAMGCEVVPPEGTFYVFPSIRRWGMNALAFATRLLQEEHVAVLPGTAFSRFGEGFIRLSLAVPDDLLEEALTRMERFVRRLGTP